MNHDTYSDAYLIGLLERTRTIAMVGASTDPTRPSFEVMEYLLGRGYRVVPVNPRASGQTILGEPVVARLADVAGDVDMVDVFRKSEAVGALVDEVIELVGTKGIRTLWMQIGVRDDAAAARAEAAGLDVVMDRCPKQEWRRLLGA